MKRSLFLTGWAVSLDRVSPVGHTRGPGRADATVWASKPATGFLVAGGMKDTPLEGLARGWVAGWLSPSLALSFPSHPSRECIKPRHMGGQKM